MYAEIKQKYQIGRATKVAKTKLENWFSSSRLPNSIFSRSKKFAETRSFAVKDNNKDTTIYFDCALSEETGKDRNFAPRFSSHDILAPNQPKIFVQIKQQKSCVSVFSSSSCNTEIFRIIFLGGFCIKKGCKNFENLEKISEKYFRSSCVKTVYTVYCNKSP